MEILCRSLLLASAALALGACTDDDPITAAPAPASTVDAGPRQVAVDAGQPRDDRPEENTSVVEPPRPVGLGHCDSRSLAFRPQDVEYSGALDRVVAVTSSPNALVLLDPQRGDVQQVALPLAPTAVSVAPDGRSAAVAHDAYVSIVDLAATSLTATIPITSDAADIVLTGDGFAHVFPRTDQSVDVHTVDIAGRREIPSRITRNIGLYMDMRARLHPGGSAIYAIYRHLTPVDIMRLDLVGGAITDGEDSPYHGDFPMCDDVWLTESGDRVFNACGTVFRTSPRSADDLTYAGRLSGGAPASRASYAATYAWIAHSSARHAVYALQASDDTPGSSTSRGYVAPPPIDVHGDDFLQFQRSIDVPCLDTKVGKQPVYGRFVFVDPSGTRLYVLGQLAASAGAAQDWTSAVIAL